MRQPSDLSSRVADLRPTAVNRVLGEVGELQAEGQSPISLMRGQPDAPTPPHIVAAAEQALRHGRTGYPDNQGELSLRQAIAEKLARDQGIQVDPRREVLVTDGATAGIALALGALVGPGDDVLVPDPIYDAYHSVVSLWGGRVVNVAATRQGDRSSSSPLPLYSGGEGPGVRGLERGIADRFVIDRAALEAAWTPRTRVLLLNTPWNPVGTVLTREELTTILEFAAARDLQIISDEIYESLVYDDRRHVSPFALSPAAQQRTVLVNSLSKTYAMTGWRVGYCVARPELIQAMLLVLQQFSRGPATFVQDAAAAALRGDQACVRSLASELQARRERVLQALTGIPRVTPLVPEGGLFVMVDVRGLRMPSDDVRRFLLREAGVVVIHGSAYGPGGEGLLRVSFAAGGEVLDRGLERLRDGLLRLSATLASGVA